MRINIIDTSSTEFNRGSFCYAPYLCYNGLMAADHDVHLYETVRPEDLDTISDADVQIVTLWSYPQIESAFLFAHFLPFTYGKDNVFFVGYRPLIEQLGLKYVAECLGFDPMQDPVFLRLAMMTYPKYYKDFKRLLLSDCDMHLRTLEKGHLVHPLFTTYGCPNGCAFCPSTENCGKNRIALTVPEAITMLQECKDQDIRYIHLTDEDFFYNIRRAYEILKAIEGWDMHLIALGSARVVRKFVETYGADILRTAGLEVIEIGFESASEAISTSMGTGKSLSDCEALAKMQDTLPARIFWLVQTFFPGETITTLNETGRFMQTYGFTEAEVVGRLRTNGTKGGLGQFFQPYHGLPIYASLLKNGMFLTERPIRLIPSYLPGTFLESKIQKINVEKFPAAIPWLKLYNVFEEHPLFEEGVLVKEYIEGKSIYEAMRNAITIAILARMEVLE
jgi:hypothetical protein